MAINVGIQLIIDLFPINEKKNWVDEVPQVREINRAFQITYI